MVSILVLIIILYSIEMSGLLSDTCVFTCSNKYIVTFLCYVNVTFYVMYIICKYWGPPNVKYTKLDLYSALNVNVKCIVY